MIVSFAVSKVEDLFKGPISEESISRILSIVDEGVLRNMLKFAEEREKVRVRKDLFFGIADSSVYEGLEYRNVLDRSRHKGRLICNVWHRDDWFWLGLLGRIVEGCTLPQWACAVYVARAVPIRPFVVRLLQDPPRRADGLLDLSKVLDIDGLWGAAEGARASGESRRAGYRKAGAATVLARREEMVRLHQSALALHEWMERRLQVGRLGLYARGFKPLADGELVARLSTGPKKLRFVGDFVGCLIAEDLAVHRQAGLAGLYWSNAFCVVQKQDAGSLPMVRRLLQREVTPEQAHIALAAIVEHPLVLNHPQSRIRMALGTRQGFQKWCCESRKAGTVVVHI